MPINEDEDLTDDIEDEVDANEDEKSRKEDLDDANLLSRKEAARILKVSERTVITLESNGYLVPHKKESGVKAPIFYEASEVEELRKARMKGGDVGPIRGNEAMAEAALNMAMAPSAIIRAFAKAMDVAQTQVVQLTEPITGMMKMLLEQGGKENRRLTDRCSQLENELFEFIDLQKTAMREDHQGKLQEITEMESLRMKREAFNRFTGYVPLLATLIGDKLSPNQRSTVRETALVDIIDKMSSEQIDALQKSGAFGQAEMAALVNMKARLEDERIERLKKEAESLETEEAVMSKKPADGS